MKCTNLLMLNSMSSNLPRKIYRNVQNSFFPYTVAIISSFVYVMFYSIIKCDIPDTNTGYKLNIY